MSNREQLDSEDITLETCREVSARIWCDPDFSHVVMDTNLCEEIAHKLFEEAKKQNA